MDGDGDIPDGPQRREFLREHFNFECGCTRCSSLHLDLNRAASKLCGLHILTSYLVHGVRCAIELRVAAGSLATTHAHAKGTGASACHCAHMQCRHGVPVALATGEYRSIPSPSNGVFIQAWTYTRRPPLIRHGCLPYRTILMHTAYVIPRCFMYASSDI